MNLLFIWSVFMTSVVAHYSVMHCNYFPNPPFYGLFFQFKVFFCLLQKETALNRLVERQENINKPHIVL